MRVLLEGARVSPPPQQWLTVCQGTCDPIEGGCQCPTRFSGDLCESCSEGFFGPSCDWAVCWGKCGRACETFSHTATPSLRP